MSLFSLLHVASGACAASLVACGRFKRTCHGAQLFCSPGLINSSMFWPCRIDMERLWISLDTRSWIQVHHFDVIRFYRCHWSSWLPFQHCTSPSAWAMASRAAGSVWLATPVQSLGGKHYKSRNWGYFLHWGFVSTLETKSMQISRLEESSTSNLLNASIISTSLHTWWRTFQIQYIQSKAVQQLALCQRLVKWPIGVCQII